MRGRHAIVIEFAARCVRRSMAAHEYGEHEADQRHPRTHEQALGKSRRFGEHGHDDGQAAAHRRQREQEVRVLPTILLAPRRRTRAVVRHGVHIHDAQHESDATSRVNDWAVSLIASAMVK